MKYTNYSSYSYPYAYLQVDFLKIGLAVFLFDEVHTTTCLRKKMGVFRSPLADLLTKRNYKLGTTGDSILCGWSSFCEDVEFTKGNNSFH